MFRCFAQSACYDCIISNGCSALKVHYATLASLSRKDTITRRFYLVIYVCNFSDVICLIMSPSILV